MIDGEEKMFNSMKQKCIKPIYDLSEGEKGQIVQIRGKVAEHRYLSALGIKIGQTLTIKRVDNTPRERIITVEIGSMELIFDKYLAHNIQVEVPVVEETREALDFQKEFVKIA
jgi:Fe2+ transport system protein FeoA